VQKLRCTLYIPYDKDILCPKCGILEDERFDFIPKAVESLKFNKAEGSYEPAMWWVGSFGDHILQILFPILEGFEDQKSDDFREFVSSYLTKVEWEDLEYMQSYMLEIAIRIHNELLQQKE